MGFTEAVQWWGEWQLRVFVLASLFLQCFLSFAGLWRKRCIEPWLRCLIWLAYLGSDAVAIYALATLFNRQAGRQEEHYQSISASLQALWAPILLIHLGGQDSITAYNIEDNELWMRHALTAVSQVAGAVYVFCKSWSGDSRFLAPAVLLFFVGTLKCVLRPWALKRVCIKSLMNTTCAIFNSSFPWSDEKYIEHAMEYFDRDNNGGRLSARDEGDDHVWKPYHLLVDLTPHFVRRFVTLKIVVHEDPKEVHRLVRYGLSAMFDMLYTKEPLLLSFFESVTSMCSDGRIWLPGSATLFGWISLLRSATLFGWITLLRFLVTVSLLPTIICQFRFIHMQTYNHTDDIITYILLSLTIALEFLLPLLVMYYRTRKGLGAKVWWPDQVAQLNLIGYLARNKNHSKIRRLMTLLGCKDYIDQELWCMKPSESSPDIIKLVHSYLTEGWTDRHNIKDVATYREFNDNRGQWTLRREGCDGSLNQWRTLRWSFDDCVLAWHLATDLCFHLAPPSPSSHETARLSREMSNYMAYLAFVNPEMLMTGARSFLFREAYRQVKETLDLMTPPDNGGAGPSPDMSRSTREGDLAGDIFLGAEKTNGKSGFGIVNNACRLAAGLNQLRTGQDDDTKMWRVIQGVWVEMLCFSAGRCRGYLHAKSLGKGGEFLSCIWLLMSHMGMETLPQRMQREKLQENKTNNSDDTTTGGATRNAHESI